LLGAEPRAANTTLGTRFGVEYAACLGENVVLEAEQRCSGRGGSPARLPDQRGGGMSALQARFAAFALFAAASMVFDAALTPARAVNWCSLTGGLFGCDSEYKPPKQPSVYQSMANADVSVDAKAAASMISGYRHNNGLGAVALDTKLMHMAESQAKAMAARNQLEHSIGGAFSDRIRRSGFDAKVAVENIGAGYHTLAEAFSGWRQSPPHRANMLHRAVTKMGIAAAYAPGSKYKVFWALVLAAPDDHRGKLRKISKN
jgi:uncharacterized protein YkwD